MDDITQIELRGFVEEEIGGQIVKIKPFTLSDYLEGAANKIMFPADKDTPERKIYMNFMIPEWKEELMRIFKERLRIDNEQATEEKLKELEWGMKELGHFLYRLLESSG